MSKKIFSSVLIASLLIPSFSFAKSAVGTKSKAQTSKPLVYDLTYLKKVSEIEKIVEDKKLYFSADAENCFKPGSSFLNSSYSFKSASEECTERTNRSRIQSTLVNIMDNYQCIQNDLENTLLSTDEKINSCKLNSAQLTKLFDKFTSFESNKDDFFTAAKMKCTILILAGAKKHMSLDNSFRSLLNNTSDNNTADGKISALNTLVNRFYEKDKAKVRSCTFTLAENVKCVAGVQNSMIREVVTKIAMKINPNDSIRNLERSQSIAVAAQNSSQRSQRDLPIPMERPNDKVNPLILTPFVREENYITVNDKKRENDQQYNIFEAYGLKINSTASSSGNRRPASVDLDNKDKVIEETALDVFTRFGFDMKAITSDFYQRNGDLTEPELKRAFSELLVDLSNKAYDQECSKSILYNPVNFCKKFNEHIEGINNEKNESLMSHISNYVKDNKKNDERSMYKDISSEAILNLANNPLNTKMNYSEFLNKLNYMENCVSKFGEKSFGSFKEKEQYESFSKVITEFVQKQNQKELTIVQEKAEEFYKSNNSSSSRFMAASYAETKSAEAKNDFLNSIKRDTSNQINIGNSAQSIGDMMVNKTIPSINNNQSSTDSSLIDKGMLTNLGTSIKSNGQINNANNSSYLSTQPLIGSNSSVIERQNSFNDSNSIQKKLEQLTSKQNELKEKAGNEGNTASSNKEMENLQKQIEELRNQLADSKKENSKIANQNTVKELAPKETNSIQNNNIPSYDFKKATYGSNVRDDRVKENSNGESSRFESSTIGSNSNSGGAQAIASRSISSIPASKSVDSIKGFGLVLTKAGETTEDISKIADNPKEADILILAEKSNGRPFIIRENGDLVQIQVKLDAVGKPIYINGKPELIKKILSKDAQVQVAKNLDAIREAKEVRDTVRLQQLNQLMLDSK